MQIHHNMIPGILTKEVEFFKVSETEAMAIHNSNIFPFWKLPNWVYSAIRKEMQNPDASIQEMESWIVAHYGGLDPYADLTEDGVFGKAEYIDTQKTLDLGNGYHLSACELRVLKLIELPNKLIADRLFISIATVESHWQNIRTKTGLANKPELTKFATRYGII